MPSLIKQGFITMFSEKNKKSPFEAFICKITTFSEEHHMKYVDVVM